MSDKRICKIEDERLKPYVKRTRSGSEQVFYSGSDSRDFDRFREDGGNIKPGVQMYDKPDTIRIAPPKRHYYAELIDGEWWWLNGCAECNGEERDWMTYIECETHNVCRTCQTPRAEIIGTPWGGKRGWQCVTCHGEEAEEVKIAALTKAAEEEFNEWDYFSTDNIICPHCNSSYEPDCEPPEGDEVCEVCGGEYTVEPEYSIKYTTRVKGERVTL